MEERESEVRKYWLPVRLKCACCSEWLEPGTPVIIDDRNRTVCTNREKCEERAADKAQKHHSREPRTSVEWLQWLQEGGV